MKLVTFILITAVLALAACDKTPSSRTSPGEVPGPEGSQAPDVMLALHNGETLALKSLRGSNVLLYFYPKDDTPG